MKGAAKARQRKILWTCVALSPPLISLFMTLSLLLGARGISVLQPFHWLAPRESLESLNYTHRITLTGDATRGWLGIRLGRGLEIGPNGAVKRQLVSVSEILPDEPS